MKTKINGLIAIVFALFMFSTMTTKAQCAKVINNSLCSVDVSGRIYDTDLTTGLCTVGCNSFSGNVPPGGSYVIPCGGCSSFCNIVLNVDAVNGAALIIPVGADFNSGPQPFPPLSCGATTLSYDAAGTFFEIN